MIAWHTIFSIAKLGKCAVEYKYDGFRIAIHKKGNRVEIYSRRLEKMTHMFPDVVAAVQKLKPKEVMYLALSAYGHWGNLEGFYELFVMRSRFRNLKAILREAGLMESLAYLAGRERGR